MKKPSFRPSPAMIVACVALFVALGGTATAVTYVVSSNSQIGPGTISGHNPPSGKHGNIISGSVNGTDLAPNSVGSSEIAANAVGASKVANDSLTLSDIAGTASNGSISLSGIPDGALLAGHLQLRGRPGRRFADRHHGGRDPERDRALSQPRGVRRPR